MDKQIVEISKDGCFLSVNRGFLTLKNDSLKTKTDIPLDNILSLILSAHDAVISKNAINAICKNGGNVIYCDEKYNPGAITVPYCGHWLISQRVNQQIDSSLPLKKNLWKEIISQKIANQALILAHFSPKNVSIKKLERLSKTVLSGDTKNNEGQAARIYFKEIFGPGFIRDRTKDDVNILLNYSYMVLRAMVARAVAGCGLFPYLGIKHCTKTNTMPLVDDLMEPFRPIADKIVVEILSSADNTQPIQLTPNIKRDITRIISYPVTTTKGKVSLSDGILLFANSLVKSFAAKKVSLEFPTLTT